MAAKNRDPHYLSSARNPSASWRAVGRAEQEIQLGRRPMPGGLLSVYPTREVEQRSRHISTNVESASDDFLSAGPYLGSKGRRSGELQEFGRVTTAIERRHGEK